MSTAAYRFAANGGARMASDKQRSFLHSLRIEYLELYEAKLRHEGDIEGAEMTKLSLRNTRASDPAVESITSLEASRQIDQLKSWVATLKKEPWRVTSMASAPELQDGIYLRDGVVYKVVHAVHGSGRQYAKRLVPDTGEWVYEGRKPLVGMTDEHRMTLAQAKEFGAVYGVCCNCGRTLTNETSIEAGIGPVCAGRFA